MQFCEGYVSGGEGGNHTGGLISGKISRRQFCREAISEYLLLKRSRANNVLLIKSICLKRTLFAWKELYKLQVAFKCIEIATKCLKNLIWSSRREVLYKNVVNSQEAPVQESHFNHFNSNFVKHLAIAVSELRLIVILKLLRIF